MRLSVVKALVVRCQGLAAAVLLLGGTAFGATISVKRGDRKPAVTWVALDSAGKRVDLTGATAQFRMREPITGCTILGTASIPSTKTGNLRYDWKLGDTDFAGSYDAEFLVTFPDLTTWTFPTVGSIPISVEPNAADPTPNNPSIYCQGSQPIPTMVGQDAGLIPQGLHVYKYRGIGYKDMKELYLGIIGPGSWYIGTNGRPSALFPELDGDRDLGWPTKRPRYVYAATGLLVGGDLGWPLGSGVSYFTNGGGAPGGAPVSGVVYLRTSGTPNQYSYSCNVADPPVCDWTASAWLTGTTTDSAVTTGTTVPTDQSAVEGSVYLRTAGGPPDLYTRVNGRWSATDYVIGTDPATMPDPIAATPPRPILAGPGAPTGTCSPSGSLWLRTDGGAGSTLYVCEGTTWAAK